MGPQPFAARNELPDFRGEAPDGIQRLACGRIDDEDEDDDQQPCGERYPPELNARGPRDRTPEAVRQRVQLARAAIVSAAATDIANRTLVATRP